MHTPKIADVSCNLPALARQLLSDGKIAVWRYLGKWNKGYHTYKTVAYVEAWKQKQSIVIHAQ